MAATTIVTSLSSLAGGLVTIVSNSPAQLLLIVCSFPRVPRDGRSSVVYSLPISNRELKDIFARN